MFAAIKNSKTTTEILLNAKADPTLANYVRIVVRDDIEMQTSHEFIWLLTVGCILTMSLVPHRMDKLPGKWRAPKVITH